MTDLKVIEVYHFIMLRVSAPECKNPLAVHYQQSQFHEKVLEELEHINQSSADGNKGQDKPASYVTSFLYQVIRSERND